MAAKTRKRKQSNLLSDEPVQQPPSTTTRTQVGRRVSTGALQERQEPEQSLCNPRARVQASLVLNDNMGLEDNHLLDSQTQSAHVQELVQQNTRELTRATDEVQNELANSENEDKKGRGGTYMLKIWGRPSTLPRIELQFDTYGRPIGPNQSKFCEFLGTIARNGVYCPLDVEDWHKMPKDYKNKMLHVVKARYDISLGDEGWILTSINKKWRNWKSNLKTRYFIPDKDVRCLVDEKDGRVLQDQWMNMLAYWNKEEVKMRSEKNKVARSKRVMNHLTGKTPFAQVSDKLVKETGHPPSRAELLAACYTRKDNTPSIVSTCLEEIAKLRSQLPEDFEDTIGPNDLYAQVCGQDKPGRVRMVGEGVSASDVWGDVPNKNMCKRIMLEQRSQLMKLEDRIVELQSKLSTERNCISQSSQSIISVSNNLPRQTLSHQHLQVGINVALKSIFDQGTTVAKGYLCSIDPNAEVGRQVLGENWCQVNVKVVVKSEEKLIRPYGHYQSLGDALGEMVAWPCNLVTPIG